ncbi:MAG: hypothetical protein RQ743_05100 [Bacteroidales bacterium]|nr:hypothetical protein [Bacteroidales bacterium]
MKNLGVSIILLGALFILSCEKEPDEVSDRFKFLTGTVWLSDSLLVNGHDGSYPGGPLENFKGEAIFNEDGTGTFGIYTGTWKFEQNETVLKITSPSLLTVLTTQVVELTATSLKITTPFYNSENPAEPLNIRMTFKPK